MPVNFFFKLKDARPDQKQIGVLFERLGWERLDAASFRYPRLTDESGEVSLEDWFNHVVPALMLFRSYVVTHRLVVEKISLDAFTSTGYRREPEVGNPPLAADQVKLYQPNIHAVPASESHDEQEWAMLEDWLDGIHFPFAL
jgi:hypothetical protein